MLGTEQTNQTQASFPSLAPWLLVPSYLVGAERGSCPELWTGIRPNQLPAPFPSAARALLWAAVPALGELESPGVAALSHF